MSSPLVSVVIPTYNRVDYLQQAIDSALAQTYSHLEVLVSDDGSSDGTASLIASYNDDRLRYRRNETNLGQTLNNRAGFLASRGKYVANLHDDDRWTPTFLERLIPPLEKHSDVTVAFSDHWVTDADGEVREDWTDTNTAYFGRDRLSPGVHKPFARLAILDLSIPTVMGAVMRRSALALDDFPTDVDPIYDLWLSYQLCRENGGAYYLPERLTYYRVHGDQESGRSSFKKTSAHIYCYKRFLADGLLPSLKSDLEARLTEHRVQLGIHYLCEGNVQDARPLLRRCFFRNPKRSVLPLLLSLLPARKAQYVAGETRKNRPLGSVLRGALRA